jgi:excisionase family DNA binding protein
MRPPVWTVTEAAAAAGVSRSTVQRLLAAGEFPGARQEEAGRRRWLLPIPAVAAHPDLDVRPPTDEPQGRLRPASADPAAVARADEMRGQLDELRAALAAVEAEARRLRDVAAERDRLVAVLQQSLDGLQRQLVAGGPRVDPDTLVTATRPRKRGFGGRVAAAIEELTR